MTIVLRRWPPRTGVRSVSWPRSRDARPLEIPRRGPSRIVEEPAPRHPAQQMPSRRCHTGREALQSVAAEGNVYHAERREGASKRSSIYLGRHDSTPPTLIVFRNDVDGVSEEAESNDCERSRQPVEDHPNA